MNAQQINDTYQAKLDRIENSRTYSDHAKKVMAAKAYTEAQTALDALRASDTQQLRDRRASLQRHMFGHADSSDPQALMARRGATQQAAELDDPRMAQYALQDAMEQGDGILAQAIAKRAYEWGWGGVLDAYAEARPHFRRSAEEFNELPDPDSDKYQMATAFSYVTPPPHRLHGTDSWKISQLASQDLGDVA